LGGRRRAQVVARCDVLAAGIDELDRQVNDLLRQRRELTDELRGHRRRLFPSIGVRGRQPGPDGSVQLPPVPHGAVFLYGRRLRALCVGLLSRLGPMPLVQLHALLHRLRYAVAGAAPVKALADALGYETDIGRVRRVRRGVYEALVTPPNRPLWPNGPTVAQLFND
jgi:hypothetical protein